MLRFSMQPDRVFRAILHAALEVTRDTLADLADEDEDYWVAQYPNAARCLTAEVAVPLLDQLLAASQDAQLYQLTDYHWLLLYDCLRVYCDIHNDDVQEVSQCVLPVGPYQVGPIDFDLVVDLYFWDTDFLLDPTSLAALGPDGRESMGVSDEVFGIAHRLSPHPEELKIIPWEGPGLEAEDEQALGPLIPRYPAAG